MSSLSQKNTRSYSWNSAEYWKAVELRRIVLRFPLGKNYVQGDFESEKNGLLGYLKGHLHNHNIVIEVIVNESVTTKKAFTPQEKYNRLNELNSNLDILRKTFELDI